MIVKPQFLATGIGSMPFDDPGYAVDLILSKLPASISIHPAITLRLLPNSTRPTSWPWTPKRETATVRRWPSARPSPGGFTHWKRDCGSRVKRCLL
ncbi:MAG: hypothetical protein NTW12_02810 [Deltaproteobacteria bacterium]|nr:hypothetical protein [Deltaproteobacteria bacterium]